jgi:hypothetical protein
MSAEPGALYRARKNLQCTNSQGEGTRLKQGTVLMYLDFSHSPRLSMITVSSILQCFGPESALAPIRRKYNIFLGPGGQKIEVLTFSNLTEDAFDKWFERIEL